MISRHCGEHLKLVSGLCGQTHTWVCPVCARVFHQRVRKAGTPVRPLAVRLAEAQARKKRPKTGTGPVRNRLCLSVDDATLFHLRAFAKRNGITLSSAMRMAVALLPAPNALLSRAPMPTPGLPWEVLP